MTFAGTDMSNAGDNPFHNAAAPSYLMILYNPS